MAKFLIFTTVFLAVVQPAFASMTISGTRIIFPASEKEVNVRTFNKGDLPALAQVWVDDGKTNADLNTMNIPFIVTPPVYRVEPTKGQSVRMIYNGMALPQDRESIFWFNLLEIPPKSNNDDVKNRLELAFRTRIKIFYRPQALEKSSSEREKEKLRWSVERDPQRGAGVKVTNMTPYYFSFDAASIVSQDRKIPLAIDMVGPNSSRVFYPATKLSYNASFSQLEYSLLNDYGAPINVTLKADSNNQFVSELAAGKTVVGGS